VARWSWTGDHRYSHVEWAVPDEDGRGWRGRLTSILYVSWWIASCL